MTEQLPLDLPDPGEGRYWEIERDSYNDLYVSLVEIQTYPYDNDAVVRQSDPITPGNRSQTRVGYEIEQAAHALLALLSSPFEGTYMRNAEGDVVKVVSKNKDI